MRVLCVQYVLLLRTTLSCCCCDLLHNHALAPVLVYLVKIVSLFTVHTPVMRKVAVSVGCEGRSYRAMVPEDVLECVYVDGG